jgi:hypothetical protein
VAASCYGYACNWLRTGEFLRIEKEIELSTGKILEKNLVQSAFYQTLED